MNGEWFYCCAYLWQDLPKYTIPKSFVGICLPTTVVGMLDVSVLHTKGCGNVVCHFLNQGQENSNLAFILWMMPLNHTGFPFNRTKFFLLFAVFHFISDLEFKASF